jgi:hypothetical protein
MMDQQEERLRRSTVRRPESPGGEERLLERAIGESGPVAAPARRSLLQPQQDRNVVWRWHVRRRRPKS